MEPVRGNVLTRLEKLDSGQYGMLILAAAGLKRLGLEGRVERCFSPDELVPAAGQGVLACQGRAGEDYWYLDAVRDRDAEDCVRAERAFVAALDGGCAAPVGAYAALRGTELELMGFYADAAGACRRGRLVGGRSDAERIGRELAQRLRGEGE